MSGLSHSEQVRRLIDGGATIVQLRDKHAAPRDFYREAEAALRIARAHHVKVIINDRVDLALALDADGVHLGQTDLPASAARKLLGPGAIIGLSTHNMAQVQNALPEPVEYIAFGPIFETATKEAPDPTVGLKELRRARSLTRLPLVGIGGITSANVTDVFAAGADAVAVISSVIADPDSIAERFRKFLAKAC